jgi:hypothetical protein
MIFWMCLLSILLMMTCMVEGSGGASDNYPDTRELWKKVEAAEADQLPKTAIQHLREIYTISLGKDRFAEALKALLKEMVIQDSIEGGEITGRIRRLEKEIPRAPRPMQPLMKVALAHWYRIYQETNRWRLLERSQVEGEVDADFTTWDFSRLSEHIAALFIDVLKEKDYLRSFPISQFDDLLKKGTEPQILRPTLYDFIAFEALDFFTAPEEMATRPQDAFVITASSPALAPAADFLKHRFETGDKGSHLYRAILLFQEIMGFHQQKGQGEAFVDADLFRLEFVVNQAVGEEKTQRYIDRLQELMETYPRLDITGKTCYLLAKALQGEERLTEALAIAQKGAEKYPDTIHAHNCLTIMARVQEKKYELKTENVTRPQKESEMLLEYKNIDRLHLRIVKDRLETYLAGSSRRSFNWIPEEDVKLMLRRDPVAQWSETLPVTDDYKTRQTRLKLPPLEPGLYMVLASFREDFSDEGNKIQYAIIQVSRIGMVLRPRDNQIEGLVVESRTGKPWPDIQLQLWDYNNRNRAYQKKLLRKTNADGFFWMPSSREYRRGIIVAEDPLTGEQLLEVDVPPGYHPHTHANFQRTFFFTDRSLYRPGQMVHFKGICVEADQARDRYQLLPNREVTIFFRDANHQEVERLKLRTNDYGSFSGTFTAPSAGLTGAFSLSTESPGGQATVRIEEYKRPKFQVTVQLPERQFNLNDDITVSGTAMAYTGAPVDGASVVYRVFREAQVPLWWRMWGMRIPNLGSPQEVGFGQVKTEVDGSFKITFNALSDLKIPKSASPVFTFRVQVDVTDSSGETRSGEARVNLGYTAMKAQMTCAPWQEEGTAVEFFIRLTTLNGKPLDAGGEVEVYSLREPDNPVPQDLFDMKSEPGSFTTGTDQWILWPEDRLLDTKTFTVDANRSAVTTVPFKLKRGVYRAKLKSKDKDGQPVEVMLPVLVAKPKAKRFDIPFPFHYAPRAMSVEVGESFEALWGTGYGEGPVLVEIFKHNELKKRYWTKQGDTQGLIKVPVTPKLKGGFTVVAHLVKENRCYRRETKVEVPYTDKKLHLKWKTFRSPLRPGQHETWAVTIAGPKAKTVAAEMVAALYDASLDQYLPHSFDGFSWIFKTDSTSQRKHYSNRAVNLRTTRDKLNAYLPFKSATYPQFPETIMYDIPVAFVGGVRGELEKAEASAPPPMAAQAASFDAGVEPAARVKKRNGGSGEGEPEVELKDVPLRTNLDETAFFYPHLLTDKHGDVTIEFQMPEALTEWKFLGFAHSKALQMGQLTGSVQTRKELMVEPNPPRFLREGDVLEFSVKVTNMTDKDMDGNVRLQWFSPGTERILDVTFKNVQPTQPVSIPANQSRSYFWKIQTPDGEGIVGFRAVAAAGDFSDGEEGLLPVLSRRMLVHESIPLWITGPGKKEFKLTKLIDSGASTTLKHQALSLQMTPNPAWYAVKALPYLMEYPHECSEQIFSRLYGNALARHIATSDPKIRQVFDAWKQADPDALRSNLQKNDALTAILLQESPWVMAAKNETDAQHKVGLLFESNRIKNELKRALGKLGKMQLSDGAWPWFPGGSSNIFITLHIVEGFGRLYHLGVDVGAGAMIPKALKYIDRWLKNYYDGIKKRKLEKENHLSQLVSLYLYARSFYIKDYPPARGVKPALDYFLAQGKQHWATLESRMNQAQLALALHRFGDTAIPAKIVASMKERSLYDEEMGRYWKDSGFSWWWYYAPIETQAMMIELFDEAAGDGDWVEQCKIWLLKQKQTQHWSTTKSTADAVYSLLLRGDNLLAAEPDVTVRLGEQTVQPAKTELGSGYFQHFVPVEEIAPSMGKVSVEKAGKGVAWGGLHWQYWDDIDHITPHSQNPLHLKKEIFKQTVGKDGPVLSPISGPLAVGDLLKVRILLKVDRDMEFVHLKDHRGSGTEPVNVLSHYKYQDRLVYYESTRDAASHFFIDYLPEGNYVFEYPLRVVHKGVYPSGMAHIECMYAPEFNSHSASIKLEVR